jgi:hypothetical protein
MKGKSAHDLWRRIGGGSLPLVLFVVLAFPASSNYRLKSFEFGAGGETGAGATNYALEGILGEAAGEANSGNYEAMAGLVFVQEADTPPAPVFENGGNWYNKLKMSLNPAGNPSDATFAVAISDDNWLTTRWVQDDNTVGDSLGAEDFQTYAEWGGTGGSFVIGLDENTTYRVRVKARHGRYTESRLGPEAQAATVSVSLSFDIDVSALDEETNSPYEVDFGDLVLGSVTTAPDKVWVDFETNAEGGGYVYIYDQYGGLRSAALNYTIPSLTGDLAATDEGFGIRGQTASQTSGGPFTVVSPYDGSGDNVGLVDATIREIFSSSGSPVTGGRGSFFNKVKPSRVTPAAGDYRDRLTLIASAAF